MAGWVPWRFEMLSLGGRVDRILMDSKLPSRVTVRPAGRGCSDVVLGAKSGLGAGVGRTNDRTSATSRFDASASRRTERKGRAVSRANNINPAMLAVGARRSRPRGRRGGGPPRLHQADREGRRRPATDGTRERRARANPCSAPGTCPRVPVSAAVLLPEASAQERRSGRGLSPERGRGLTTRKFAPGRAPPRHPRATGDDQEPARGRGGVPRACVRWLRVHR